MRTIILVGLLSICDAINPEWMPKEHLWFYIVIFCVAILGDIYTTINNNNNKNNEQNKRRKTIQYH